MKKTIPQTGPKLIIISNRLPVTIKKQDGKLTFNPSSGGLATAMASVGRQQPMLWLGWPGIVNEELTPADKRLITRELKRYSCIPVFLSAEQVEKFYEGYSNETLWPLFHYFQEITELDEENWRVYRQVNQLFAKATLKFADSESTIWVHDYHFALLPQLLRHQLPDAAIGFFLHIPFPSFEIFRLLPHRRDIIDGLLGANLLGFHIYDYVRHFNSSVMRTVGVESKNGQIEYEGRLVKADAFPIGIDYEKFRSALQSKSIGNELSVLHEHYNDKKIILSVDRLDYSKGIVKRLEAYEEFLAKNPQHHKKVSLVMVAVPSRTEVDAYKELRDNVEQTVSRINGTYASVDWTPVSYQFQNLPFDKLVALYTRADIALVTPVRDGMNLVAKEFVASQGSNPGVLILSEMAGAVDELPEALVVNPNSSDEIVQSLQTALKMPLKQRKQRMAAMQRRLSMYDVTTWANDFLDVLKQTHQLQKERKSNELTTQDISSMKSRYSSAKRRLIVLDYDGTLQPFVNSADPSHARPSLKLQKVLTKLSSDNSNTLYIVSGRPRVALELWFRNKNIKLIAEHGYWVKHDDVWLMRGKDMSRTKEKVLPTLIKYTERTPGAVLEDKNSSLVWHYRNVAPELAFVRRRSLKQDLKELLNSTDAEVFSGNKILEIKPKGVNKGNIVHELLEQGDFDYVICCGDDYTDEDMFKALPDKPATYSIKVGLGKTAAKKQVASTSDIHKLLEQLAAAE